MPMLDSSKFLSCKDKSEEGPFSGKHPLNRPLVV